MLYTQGDGWLSGNAQLSCPETCPAKYLGTCLSSVAMLSGLVYCASSFTSNKINNLKYVENYLINLFNL
jgi:hypothetical protein